jgi:hypothetical protein
MRISKNIAACALLGVSILSGAAASAAPAGAAAAAGTPAVSAGHGPLPPIADQSGTLDCSQLESLWEYAGGSPSAAFLAAEVAMAESGGQQDATNVNTDGSTDEGYWQINNYAHPGQATFDPLGNAKAAVSISADGTNWTPWMTYDSGKQNGQCQ